MEQLLVTHAVFADNTKGALLCAGEKIVAVGQESDVAPLAAPDAKILDAQGQYVLPGCVDAHTHLNLTISPNQVMDGFKRGSIAALYGGTTTIIEHPGFHEGPASFDIFSQIVKYHASAQITGCYTDYAFHLVFQPTNAAESPEDWPQPNLLHEAVQAGYPSGKAYTTYAGKLSDAHLLRLMEKMAEAGCLLTVHAENDAIPVFLKKHLPPQNPFSHALSRPPLCEAEAIERILSLAFLAGCDVYIVHLSTQEGLEAIKRGRDRGQKIYAETCPQYLVLDESLYKGPQGRAYICAPPLRAERHRQALWEGLANGDIDVVATDHCAFSYAQKEAAPHVFACPGGLRGIDTRLPLLFTYGVEQGKISLTRMVQLLATNPARIFGLPQKGHLSPDADADFFVLDTNTTPPAINFYDTEPYATLEQPLAVWPRHLFLRGNAQIMDGSLQNTPTNGCFLKRRRYVHFSPPPSSS